MQVPEPCPPCRLCGDATHFFHRDKRRDYYQCDLCGAVMVPERFFLTEEDEKKEYDLHENGVLDDGYRKFLSRAAEPLRIYLSELHCSKGTAPTASTQHPITGLDFGSGPFPALSTILEAPPYNYRVILYDKYYCPSTEHALRASESLDFITATEVVEHLKDPLPTLHLLWNALKRDGVMVIMTKRVDGSVEKFRNWHYIRDPTHITFYHEKTFEWIGSQLSAGTVYTCEVRLAAADVVLLVKSGNQ